MKLSRKLAALAMAVLLAVSLTACSPKQVAQDMVVHLVHKLGLVEESDEDDTDTTTKAPAGGSVEFPAEMDTTAARVVTYPVEDTLYVSFNGIANRSTEYFVAGPATPPPRPATRNICTSRSRSGSCLTTRR